MFIKPGWIVTLAATALFVTAGCLNESSDGHEWTHVADPQGGSIEPWNGFLTLGPDNIYFGYAGQNAGGVAMAAKDGSSASCVACDQGEPRELAAGGSSVYWVDKGLGQVRTAPLGGGEVATLWTGSVGTPVAVDQSHVYWFDSGAGALMQADLDGGNPTQVATGQSGVISMAADSGFLYWINASQIVELDLSVGTPTVIAQGQISPRSAAVDSMNVYWAAGPWGEAETVQRIPRGGGEVVQLAAAGAHAIALDDNCIYAADNYGGQIWKMAKTGGDIQVLATDQPYPFDIAVDDSAVYWSSETDATVAKVPK
jgi:hypothetical protein